ncbi:MAG TPA: class I SAM-dependent methyltransferase [Anaeromyxobacter sp.]|nr:class I SAM-dependent methyltransferase [Anaeromyxobacter sp.]
MGDRAWSLQDVAVYWDRVAERYLELFRDELAGKPFDRRALDAFAERIGRGGHACDVGCGPCGHVTRYLADRGLDMIGVDISPRCITLARREQPSLRFDLMDMSSLGFRNGTMDGIVAYYAIHYQPAATLPAAIEEFFRVLRPGGELLLVAKDGEGEGWIEDPLGGGEPIFWTGFTAGGLAAAVAAGGFTVDHVEVRQPQVDEIAAKRIYVAASRPRR